MPQSGSKPHHLRNAILAAVFAAVIAAVAWTLTRRHGTADPLPQAIVATTTGASEKRVEQHAGETGAAGASKPTRKFQVTVANTALPPEGTPLAQTYDELKARADAGDAAAASRLFSEAQHCFQTRQTVRFLPHAANIILNEDTSKLDADELSKHEKRLADMEQNLAKAKSENEPCEGLSDAQLQLTPLALQAAQLGDTAASDCYVSGFLLYSGGLLDHPEWLQQYKSNAMTIAQAALEQGDWRMVASLRNAYGQTIGSAFTPLAQLTGGDRVQYYRYLKLQLLGATDKNANSLGRQVAEAAQSLTAVDVNAGDAWAQDIYLRFFGGTQSSADQNDMSFCSP